MAILCACPSDNPQPCSPIIVFTYNIKEATGDIESATIKDLGGHITAKEKEANEKKMQELINKPQAYTK